MATVIFCKSIISPLCLGAAFSFLLERLLLPKPALFWRRSRGALMIHLGLWIVLFAFELTLFQRPYFAAANVLALFLFVVMVSNAKYQALREPFLLQDFAYFINTVKHPRLFVPFFGVRRVLVATTTLLGALLAGMTLENSLIGKETIGSFWAGVAILCILGASLVWLGSRQGLALTLEPETDLKHLGLLTSLWCYGAEERKAFEVPAARVFSTAPVRTSAELPNLIAVESESFFDVRRLFAGIRPEVLRHFDLLKQSAVRHGLLEVPAWGANTVRTEFAFLSGLGSDAVGIHRFNPYRYAARQGVPTLATYLKNVGYRTVCVHPYPSGFYARDRVFPQLGFDEFIDIRFFNGARKSGAYVGDVALAQKVCGLLESHGKESTRPVFLFIITMENHGPVGLESLESADAARYYVQAPPAGCEDLGIYLRHLVNADRMIGILREHLESLSRNSCLCFFGDHLPILEKAYSIMGTPSGHTEYVVWQKEPTSAAAVSINMRIEDLGLWLVQQMGLHREPGLRGSVAI